MPLTAVAPPHATGHALTLWDQRVGERQGCVHYLTPGTSPLFAVGAIACGGGGSAVAVAGSERCVHVYDMRTCSVRVRWNNALKYTVGNLLLTQAAGGAARPSPISPVLAKA